MKKREGSLLQSMMAVLLSAMLVTGMVSNAAPASVQAQKPDGQQESVSGNTPGTVEGGTEIEEETEPGTVGGNDAANEDAYEQWLAGRSF